MLWRLSRVGGRKGGGRAKSSRARRAVFCFPASLLLNPTFTPASYLRQPANILHELDGTVRIADFGLSKVVQGGGDAPLELTSQGAGTYWCARLEGPRSPR